MELNPSCVYDFVRDLYLESSGFLGLRVERIGSHFKVLFCGRYELMVRHKEDAVCSFVVDGWLRTWFWYGDWFDQICFFG